MKKEIHVMFLQKHRTDKRDTTICDFVFGEWLLKMRSFLKQRQKMNVVTCLIGKILENTYHTPKINSQFGFVKRQKPQENLEVYPSTGGWI